MNLCADEKYPNFHEMITCFVVSVCSFSDLHIIACRPVARQRPQDRTAVTMQRSINGNRNCFLRVPYRGVISGTVSEESFSQWS